MTAVLRCPNPSCGRESHLGEDPLGRIFRCPRCLTKLPTAAATQSDSGWTDVLGPLPRRQAGVPARASSPRIAAAGPPERLQVPGQGFVRLPSGSNGEAPSGSGEFLVMGFSSGRLSQSRGHQLPGAGSPESGEIYVGAIGHEHWSDSGPDHFDHEGPALADSRLGRFQVIEELGEGRHSTVYRAFDPLLRRQVAVKRLSSRMATRGRGLERFLGEARALAQLNHPRIVPIYEAGCDHGRYYIAMELIEGQSLADRLTADPPPFGDAAEIVRDLAGVLAYTHSLGIVHRDVKPANIRLDRGGRAYLMDFGIAYRPDSGEFPSPRGSILGTPAYVSPEQARGQTAGCPASDQYSLGAVLYQLLCGRPPFQGPLPHVLFSTIHHDPPPPRSVRPKVPHHLDAICRRAMAKQPERRYPSCQELADDLRLWLHGKAPSVGRRSWSFLGL